jgi:hypothetical protein
MHNSVKALQLIRINRTLKRIPLDLVVAGRLFTNQFDDRVAALAQRFH